MTESLWSWVGGKRGPQRRIGSEGLPTFEQLEPRLLLSGDSLFVQPLPSLEVPRQDQMIVVDLRGRSEQTEATRSAIFTLGLPPSANPAVRLPNGAASASAAGSVLIGFDEIPAGDQMVPVASANLVNAGSTATPSSTQSLPGTLEGNVEAVQSAPTTSVQMEPAGPCVVHQQTNGPLSQSTLPIDIRGPPDGDCYSASALSDGSYALDPQFSGLTGGASTLLNSGPQSPNVPGPQLADPNLSYRQGQVIYLEFDGEQNVTYDGPVAVGPFDVSAFSLEGTVLAGQEETVITEIISQLQQAFAGSGITFITDKPTDGSLFSTIFIGGDSSAFGSYGPFVGLSERIDTGNADEDDIAFVFPENLSSTGLSATEYGTELAGYVAHEAGHLMGYQHAYQIDANDPLSALAFKPYVHIEIARDVRADLLEDGKVTVAGVAYDVNPMIVEAIRKYPSYFYAGSVGPDGFPEVIMGGTVIHPDSTGIWVTHILNKAWEVQKSDKYSPEEKLQALAFAYGYPMHVAADTWSHTLVNQFSEGVWPDLKMVIGYDQARANVIRHLLLEGYIADATPGFDGVKTVDDETQRTLLPDGDVSNDSSWVRELNIPTRFVFDALIDDLPDLPAEVQRFLFAITPAEVPAYPPFNPASVDSWRGVFSDKEPLLNQEGINETGSFLPITEIDLASDAVIRTITAGEMWQIKSEYYFYTIKAVKNDAGTATLRWEVYSTYKSRGPACDALIDTLRPALVHLAEKLEGTGSQGNPDIDAMAAAIDPILANMEALVKGEGSGDAGQLFDQLKALGSQISTSVQQFYEKVSSGGDIGDTLESFVTDFSASMGQAAQDYLRYWIKNIDALLQHWPDLGLAISRGLFDPQEKRDLQNENGTPYATAQK